VRRTSISSEARHDRIETTLKIVVCLRLNRSIFRTPVGVSNVLLRYKGSARKFRLLKHIRRTVFALLISYGKTASTTELYFQRPKWSGKRSIFEFFRSALKRGMLRAKRTSGQRWRVQTTRSKVYTYSF